MRIRNRGRKCRPQREQAMDRLLDDGSLARRLPRKIAMTTLCLSDAFGFADLPPEAVVGRPKTDNAVRDDETEIVWLLSLAREPARG